MAVTDNARRLQVPTTWTEFNDACEVVMAAGKICLAHGATDWSDTTTSHSVVYGMDLDLYRKAFQEGDLLDIAE